MASFVQHCMRIALALCTLAAAQPAAAARLDPALAERLQDAGPEAPLEVIVTFHGEGPPDAQHQGLLQRLGLAGVTLRALPVAGVLATPAQVDALLGEEQVRSVWLNAPLQYEHRDAGPYDALERHRAGPLLRSEGAPYSGRGIGVLINGSGDGTWPDLRFPEHAVQNVAASTALRPGAALAPIRWIENGPQTDVGGIQGTDPAGLVAGTGAASEGGQFEGVAPGADVIGYASGAAPFVFDALGGFDYALTHQFEYNIRVVSNAFGNGSDVGTRFDPDDPTNVATRALADRGVVVVFSTDARSGDEALTGNFKKAPWVLAADGDSLAAPQLAGVVALMLEADPSLSWREVKLMLRGADGNAGASSHAIGRSAGTARGMPAGSAARILGRLEFTVR